MRLLAQEPILLRGSLLANLTAFAHDAGNSTDAWNKVARPSAREGTRPAARRQDASEHEAHEEASRVLRGLGLGARLDALPRGLYTSVSACELSEGERQLISLARALVSGGRAALRVLLCDEPTSSVDLESDQKVHDMLLALPCTVVVLAHRLHRIRSFDQVVVLDGGRVAEQGRPDELLANPQSRLAGLWKNAGLPQG